MARQRKTEQTPPPATQSTALSKEAMQKAIVGTRGIIAEIARKLGVTRQTVYNALERYPELKHDLKEAREALHDDIENTIMNEALGGWRENPYKEGEYTYSYPNATLLMYYSKTQMRDRGYIEKMQLDISPELLALLPQLQSWLTQAGYNVVDVLKQMIEDAKVIAEGKSE